MFKTLVAGVVLLAAAACTQVASDQVEGESSDLGDETTLRPEDGAAAPTSAEEVVTKRAGAPSSDHHVWAAWADSDQGLAALWSEFGHPPASLPDVGGGPVVLVATGESGSCPLAIRDVVVDGELLELDLVEDPPDGVCTADFNPVTFVLAMGSDDLRPPFVVDFGETSVQVEEADTVAAADHGDSAY